MKTVVTHLWEYKVCFNVIVGNCVCLGECHWEGLGALLFRMFFTK